MVATFQDAHLLNPWGLSHDPTTPWWVSDNGAGVTTLYDGNGTAVNPLAPGTPPLVVTIPPPAGSPAGTTAAPTGNGRINAYDLNTGEFLGQLRDQTNAHITIDDLWALGFGNDANAGLHNELFFTAGINDEADGLFGKITFVG